MKIGDKQLVFQGHAISFYLTQFRLSPILALNFWKRELNECLCHVLTSTIHADEKFL
jgi:hypothetical protein